MDGDGDPRKVPIEPWEKGGNMINSRLRPSFKKNQKGLKAQGAGTKGKPLEAGGQSAGETGGLLKKTERGVKIRSAGRAEAPS